MVRLKARPLQRVPTLRIGQEFFDKRQACQKRSMQVHERLQLRRQVFKCRRVKVTDVSKMDSCSIKAVPQRRISKGSKGYVLARNIGVFKGCGLVLDR